MNKDQIVDMLKMECFTVLGNVYLTVKFPGVVFAAVFFQLTSFFQLYACKISHALKSLSLMMTEVYKYKLEVAPP